MAHRVPISPYESIEVMGMDLFWCKVSEVSGHNVHSENYAYNFTLFSKC